MQAIFLVQQGTPHRAFEMRDVPTPTPGPTQVLVKVEASGLNYADVMARRGLYKEAPPIPCVLGYDVAGTVEQVGDKVTGFAPGDRVMAMTRFGGYAQYAIAETAGLAHMPPNIAAPAATALATQYCTAYYMAAVVTNLFPGDKVLIQSGAGGVGTALIQYCLHAGCQVFATAGSDAKVKKLAAMGVHHPINYNTTDFAAEIRRIAGKAGIDAAFDAVGGQTVKKSMGLLNAGGRLVCYGASTLTNRNIFSKVKAALDFGIYHPAMLMMPSKSIIGVNMLKIADHKPAILQRCLQQVSALAQQGVFKPETGAVFAATDIGKAHELLESRGSTGKVAVTW